jgi:hypothetical protein
MRLPLKPNKPSKNSYLENIVFRSSVDDDTANKICVIHIYVNTYIYSSVWLVCMLCNFGGCYNKNTQILWYETLCQRMCKVAAAATAIWPAAAILILRRILRDNIDMHGLSCEVTIAVVRF